MSDIDVRWTRIRPSDDPRAVIEAARLTGDLHADVPVSEREQIVFLHGWGLGPCSYLPVLEHLAVAGHDVHALALPGFAGSTPLPIRGHGVNGTAKRILGAIEAHAPLALAMQTGERLHLVGHSYGGATALRIAARRPDLVASLTLICPAGGASDGIVGPHRMAGSLVADAFHTWTPRAMADLIPNLMHHPLAVAAQGIGAIVANQLDDARIVSAHGIPTLMSFADHDDVISAGRFLDLDLQGVDVEMVRGRHSWMLTEPRRFAAKVLGQIAHAQNVAAYSAPVAA